jgi:transglutaminase-like putative cysteine protease
MSRARHDGPSTISAPGRGDPPSPAATAPGSRIRIGYALGYELAQPTPMIATLNVHYSRVSDLDRPDTMVTTPSVPCTAYRDSFGNWCTRLVAPEGPFLLTADAVIRDPGTVDPAPGAGVQHPVEQLPDETLIFLLPSRYCESDRFLDVAWTLFGAVPAGWPRVQAVNEWVHQRITFGYEWARPTKTAWEAFEEQQGVCRDFAHLGVALCRAMNIPARYCTGYLPDIGVPPVDSPMDFSGWFEVFLDGSWWTVDPRNLRPRVGRVLIARGRDAADVAITTTFGPCELSRFEVWADEVAPATAG